MGEPAILNNEQRLALARELVTCLEDGRESDVSRVLQQLRGERQDQLCREVSDLTRELHDTINCFVNESNLADVAHSEMPDAAERLAHVIRMTEDASNTTLAAVEDAMPLARTLRNDACRLVEALERLQQPGIDDFDRLAVGKDLESFLRDTQANADALNSGLKQVLMAQEHQDLTGQIIQNVIQLVRDVEATLVRLVSLSDAGKNHLETTREGGRKQGSDVHGPIVPGVDKVDGVADQDEVDDLLSSLGL